MGILHSLLCPGLILNQPKHTMNFVAATPTAATGAGAGAVATAAAVSPAGSSGVAAYRKGDKMDPVSGEDTWQISDESGR